MTTLSNRSASAQFVVPLTRFDCDRLERRLLREVHVRKQKAHFHRARQAQAICPRGSK